MQIQGVCETTQVDKKSFEDVTYWNIRFVMDLAHVPPFSGNPLKNVRLNIVGFWVSANTLIHKSAAAQQRFAYAVIAEPLKRIITNSLGFTQRKIR